MPLEDFCKWKIGVKKRTRSAENQRPERKLRKRAEHGFGQKSRGNAVLPVRYRVKKGIT